MAEALDLETRIYTKIWDLLNANADWGVDVQNQIRYDNIQGMQTPDKKTTADGDYPQAELWIRSGTTNVYTGHETFDTYSEGGPHQPWLETHTYSYRLKLKSQLLKLSEPDKLGAESRKALRVSGPRLGLSYITRWVMSWTTSEQNRDDNDGVRRWVTVIDIQIQVQISGSSL